MVDLKDLEFGEDDLVITFKYAVDGIRFDMVYHKEKDKVLVLRQGKPCGLEGMTPKEIDGYKEALEICICYHHNKENEPLH